MAVHEETKVINNPDFDAISVERIFWYSGNQGLVLPATGFIIAVNITSDPGEMPSSHVDAAVRAQFLFRYPGWEASPKEMNPGDRYINWGWEYRECGIAFTPPLANMNAALNFSLHKVNPVMTDDLTVTLVSAWVKRQ